MHKCITRPQWVNQIYIYTYAGLTLDALTHWGRATHICISKLIIIGSNDGSPRQHQAIIWTNADLLSIGPLGTNFSEIRIKIQNFLFMKMNLKMSSARWRPSCRGNALTHCLPKVPYDIIEHDQPCLRQWFSPDIAKPLCQTTRIFISEVLGHFPYDTFTRDDGILINKMFKWKLWSHLPGVNQSGIHCQSREMYMYNIMYNIHGL